LRRVWSLTLSPLRKLLGALIWLIRTSRPAEAERGSLDAEGQGRWVRILASGWRCGRHQGEGRCDAAAIFAWHWFRAGADGRLSTWDRDLSALRRLGLLGLFWWFLVFGRGFEVVPALRRVYGHAITHIFENPSKSKAYEES
jgi:hypothetical protein